MQLKENEISVSAKFWSTDFILANCHKKKNNTLKRYFLKYHSFENFQTLVLEMIKADAETFYQKI